VLACAWYPFPPEFRTTAVFKQVFGVESIVWGLYLLARSALLLTILLHSSVGSFVVVNILTGTPATLALIAWSIWYTIRRLQDADESRAHGQQLRASVNLPVKVAVPVPPGGARTDAR
jgi:hypothetical protein